MEIQVENWHAHPQTVPIPSSVRPILRVGFNARILGNFFGMNIPPGLCVGSVPPSAPADSVLRRPSHGAYDVHDKRIAGLTTRRVWAIGHFRHRESIRIRGEDA